jgi:hypothetical protein
LILLPQCGCDHPHTARDIGSTDNFPAGVTFIEENGEGPGVRFRKAEEA